MANYPTPPPNLDLSSLSKADQQPAKSVHANLVNVSMHAYHFRRDLQLFDHCRASEPELWEQLTNKATGEWPHGDDRAQRRIELDRIKERISQYADWGIIAARDGAMNINHFGIATAGVRQALSMCPGLRDRVDHKALRQAVKDFDAAFPHSRKIRDAVAHAAEKSKTPDHLSEHAFSGDFVDRGLALLSARSVTVTSHVSNRKYIESWDGQMFEYEISEESAARLEALQKAIFTAFP